MRGNTLRLKVLHDEGVKTVIDHALAVELIYLLSVKRRGIVPKLQDEPGGVIRQKDRLGFTRIKLFTSLHSALTLVEMFLQHAGASHR